MIESGTLSTEARRVTRAAVLISVGNIASRALGLVREMAKSYYFGAGGAVSAFDVAAQVPVMLNDQLVGGMLSSSLVPVLSGYAQGEDRRELWRVLGQLLLLLSMILGVLVVGLEVAAPIVAQALGRGLPQESLALATAMVRMTAPAVLFLNLAGLLSAALYALQRFRLPAFTGAVYNAVMVIAIILLGRSGLGVRALAVGLLAATVAQLLLQLPGLRGVRFEVHSLFPLHPALLQVGKLYFPIGVGLLMDQASVALSFNLASRTGPSGIAWMKYAATLIQFPLGLVVTAISVAILPTLSRYAAGDEDSAFRATLAQGLRLVLTLVLPAAVALLVMAEPLVAVVLQRGQFLPSDTVATAQVLRLSVLGLVFAALDQPLIFAFYARKDTWTPALVGVVTVTLYVLMTVLPALLYGPQLWQLVLANSLKLAAHALLMLYLFIRRVGSLRGYGMRKTVVGALAAALLMGLPVWKIQSALEGLTAFGTLGYGVMILVTGGLGFLIYLGLLRVFGLDDLKLAFQALRHHPAEAP
ncbi:MAG TPA: murein biosynthesis integral membrane protein MurJ [Chloroflexi bacterium]|nr:murein biosynthesis integral membrane protein MurJ [Chloroflexota bacterium]